MNLRALEHSLKDDTIHGILVLYNARIVKPEKRYPHEHNQPSGEKIRIKLGIHVDGFFESEKSLPLAKYTGDIAGIVHDDGYSSSVLIYVPRANKYAFINREGIEHI